VNLRRCKEFANLVNRRECGFLLLCGLPGNGKTRLASNIVRKCKREDALYVTQGQITVLHRKTYSQRYHVIIHRHQDYDQEAPSGILQLAQNVFLLVFDDIGSHAMPADELLLIDEVLKYRFDNRKPTILISNLPLTGTSAGPGLKEFLGDALCDRIDQATGNGRFILQFSGESFRRRSGESYLQGLKA
jgi:DNA replication protein DnaC